MNGQKISPVISFLDDLEKQRSMAEVDANLAADPTIKMRRLQAAKDDGREKCLSYIFGQVCANAVPSPSEVPYKPAPIPDLDKVVGDFIASRTGGQGATFYVKEAIKRNSDCAKNLLESVNKMLNDMYLEKELNPDTIEQKDLEFQMTPAVTDQLGKIIRDNNMEELAEAIKSNVKADAVDEVIAAKQEKDKRMALEEELRNDPNITTPEQIQEAVDARFNPRDLVVFQPRLFEGIMIKHFNEAASKTATITEAGTPLRITNGSLGYRGYPVLDSVNDMFMELEPSLEKYSERLRQRLTTEYRETARRYYWDIMPIDVEKICERLRDLIGSGQLDSNQKIEVMDTDGYILELEKLRTSLQSGLANGVEIIDLPIRISKTVAISEIPEILFHDIKHIKLVRPYGPTAESYASFAEQIVAKYGRDHGNLEATYKSVALAGLMETDVANMYITNASNLIDKIRDVIQESETAAPMTEAFVNALYEYTMFNVARAFRLEEFSLPVIRDLATSYAQNK